MVWPAVYNQDNREKVARDEAKYEEEQKVLRQKNRKAESEFRHAALLARVRAQPLVRTWRNECCSAAKSWVVYLEVAGHPCRMQPSNQGRARCWMQALHPLPTQMQLLMTL